MSIKINHRLHRLKPQIIPNEVNQRSFTSGSRRDAKTFTTFGAQIVILVSGFWFLVSNCYAAPCYGTKMPKRKGFFVGIQTHSIFKRHLEDELGKIRSRQEFVLLSYGVFDWLSIDLKGGSGNVKQRPLTSDEIDYTSNFAGGYGLRVKLYPVRNTRATKGINKISNGVNLVFGFQHISVHPKTTHLGDIKHRAILDDWQTSLLAAYDFKRITPYLGIKGSRLDYIHWIGQERKRIMSDLTKGIGLIVGGDFSLSEKFWLNLEGQFFDSQALAFSLNFSF